MNHNNWIYQGTTAIEPFASTVSQFAQSLRMPLFLLCLFCFLIAISIISPASETSAIHKHLEDHFGLGGVQSITDALVVPRKNAGSNIFVLLVGYIVYYPFLLLKYWTNGKDIYTILCQKCLLTRKSLLQDVDGIYAFLRSFEKKNLEMMPTSPDYWCEHRYFQYKWDDHYQVPSATCSSPRYTALGLQTAPVWTNETTTTSGIWEGLAIVSPICSMGPSGFNL